MMSLFGLAFEQAERELGARIGYPALVYEKDASDLRAQLDQARRHIAVLLKWSPLPQYAINNEQRDAVIAARAFLRGAE